MTHCLGFLLTALQGSVGGIDVQREGRIGQGVLVAATHKRLAWQGGQTLQLPSRRLASLVAPPAKAAAQPAPPEVKPASAVAPPPPPEPAAAAAPPPEPAPAQESGSAVGAAAVEAAKSQIGTPYVWGGAAPGGFDCSGLTSWAYKQAGLDIPRVAADQTVGRQVSYEELQPGDLVLWSGHAAMYAGDGMMIEAGSPVQMNPVRTENLGMTFRGFWRPTG